VPPELTLGEEREYIITHFLGNTWIPVDDNHRLDSTYIVM